MFNNLRAELDGLALLTQVGKGDAQEGINSYRDSHHTNIVRMVAIAHQLTDR